MFKVEYPPMGDLVFDETYFVPACLARMSAEIRLMADMGYHHDPDLAFAQSALWDSFRETWMSILALPVPSRKVERS